MKKTITSTSNPLFKKLLELLEPRGIKKQGLTLVAGRKIVPEILNSVKFNITYCLISADQIVPVNLPQATQLIELATPLFRAIDSSGTKAPILVIDTPKIESYDLAKPPQGCEVLCALGDPKNLGSLMRSCEAFGVHQLILLENSCHPFHPKCIKTSSGSALRLKIVRGPSLSALNDLSLFKLNRGGTPLHKHTWPENFRLLLGEEGPGFTTALEKSKDIEIPMSSELESLNAATAAAIALYSYYSSSRLLRQ